MKKPIYFLIVFSICISSNYAQTTLPDSCKLSFGTNLDGLKDWSTELPFVDLMHSAREWYTKDIGNPDDPWDTEMTSLLEYRSDGYPTHIPQVVDGALWGQGVATVWAVTSGWEAGEYTVLWDGVGELSLWGGASNVLLVNSHKMTFDFDDPIENMLELTIVASDVNDPVHNIRVLMPGTESTYQDQPFNSAWLEKLSVFGRVRFMDWGQTNDWGQAGPWSWDDPSFVDWSDRAKIDYYTWATVKGIPYEMMIRLMNLEEINGWVCVPHNASDEYIESMALLFKENLDSERILHVEYSNEIWNWMFGQTNWLYQYGCVDAGLDWPEGIVPYIQNCMDIWTSVYGIEVDRVVRVVGVQTSWQDVSSRIVNNLTVGSFDDIAPSFYFGLSEEADSALDVLGASATVSDIAYWARDNMDEEYGYIQSQIDSIVIPLEIGMSFYEGGQHFTAEPFGEMPSYAQALLNVQRDTSMYNMYNEWFDILRNIENNNEPLTLMNYSFIGERSAQYGSWGILESINQDISVVPAPKYQAIIDNMNTDCTGYVGIDEASFEDLVLYPNPSRGTVKILSDPSKDIPKLIIRNILGEMLSIVHVESGNLEFELPDESGIYFIEIGSLNYKIIRQ